MNFISKYTMQFNVLQNIPAIIMSNLIWNGLQFKKRMFISTVLIFVWQVQALLGDKRVTEALELAKNANKAGLTRDKFLKVGSS